MTVNTAGYPGDLDSAQNMYGANGPTDSATDNRIYYSGNNGMDTAGGQSGSSVWRYDATAGNRYVNAIHAYGDTTQNSGTRINSTKFNSLQTWIADDTTNLLPTDLPSLVDPGTWGEGDDSFFSPSTIAVGESFSANTKVINNGTANAVAYTVRFRLSTDSSYDTSDLLLGDASVSATNAISTTFASISGTMPNISPGTYYLVWSIDAFGNVAEFDETNNSERSLNGVGLAWF